MTGAVSGPAPRRPVVPGSGQAGEPRDLARCQAPDGSGHACRARASWRVSIGSRRSDAQLACGRHLNMAALAMLGAEGRASAVLAVTPVAGLRALAGLSEYLSPAEIRQGARP